MKKFFLLIAVLLFLINCTSDKKNNESLQSDSFFSKNNYGGTVQVATTDVFTGFLPYVSKGESSEFAMNLIYSSFFKYNDKGEVVPDIIDTFKIDNNSIVLSPKNNIYWHNGEKLTIDDLLFSLKIAQQKNILKDILEIQKNNNSIKILFNSIVKIKSFIAVRVLNEKLLNKQYYNVSSIIYNPIGTGPYKFVSNKDNKIILQYFDKYYSKRANIDKFIINIFKNNNEIYDDILKIDIFYDLDLISENYKKISLDRPVKQLLIFNSTSKFFSKNNNRDFFIKNIKKVFDKHIKDKSNYEITNTLFDNFDFKCSFKNNLDSINKKYKIRLLIPKNNNLFLNIANDIKKEFTDLNIKIVKTDLSEIIYYMEKGLRSDIILLNWQNFSDNSLINFFKKKKNIFGIDYKIESSEFAKKILCDHYIFPISKSIENFYFKNKIKNIHKINKYKLNSPYYWYIQQ
jgi:peptide/nickel transport system substrate-binding protein